MSEQTPLTDGAPSTEPVAPAAPPVTGEVTVGSGPQAPAAPAPGAPAEDPWKTRFDGLMSSYNKLQDRVKELERAKLPPEERVKAEEADLNEQLIVMQAALAEMEIERAKSAALTAYPEVAPFADLLFAETPEDVLELAKDLSARLQGRTPAPPVTAPVTPGTPVLTPTLPAAPVVPSGTPATVGPDADSKVAEAIKAKDFGGLMQALFERQQLRQSTPAN